MAATVTDLANGTSTTSNTTVTTGSTVTVSTASGDWLVVLVAAANASGTGQSSLSSISDSGGVNVYTERLIKNADVGAASEGATLGMYTCQVTSNLTNGTVTANFSTNTPQKAIQVYRVRPAAGETISYEDVGSGIAGATTTWATGSNSRSSGDILFGALALETDDAITGDSDTTNGSWSSAITRLADGGADEDAMSLFSQYKNVTGSGIQAWTATVGVNRDGAASWMALNSAVVPKSITASSGTYGVFGTSVSLEYGLKVAIAAGSYAVTGSAVTFTKSSPRIQVAGGSYAVSGTAVATLHKWKTTLAGGSYAVSGTDTGFNKSGAFSVVVLPGSYAVTGTAVNTVLSVVIAASAGSYAVTGSNVTFRYGREVAPDEVGSYGVTGTAVTLTPTLAASVPIRGTLLIAPFSHSLIAVIRPPSELMVESHTHSIETEGYTWTLGVRS